MIVRPHPTGWRITLHPAHGLLAAELYRHLPVAVPTPLFLPTLLAVAQHDDHQLEFASGDYLTESGAPKDFTLLKLNSQQRSAQAEALLNEAARKHAWTSLLIGMHYEFLYTDQRVNGRMKQLLKSILATRKRLLKARKWSATLLNTVYGQLRFCDRLSLILCGEELPTLGRKLEINDALGESSFVYQQEGSDTLSVTPWPFTDPAFTVVGESHLTTQLSFESSAVLGQYLADSLPDLRSWHFSR